MGNFSLAEFFGVYEPPVEDARQLSDKEYNRRYQKFFPKTKHKYKASKPSIWVMFWRKLFGEHDKQVNDVQELSDEEYDRRFSRYYFYLRPVDQDGRSGDTWRPDYDTGIGFSRSNSRSICDDGYYNYFAHDYFMDNSRAGGPGFYGSFSEAAANGAFCGPSSGGPGFYS